MMPGIEIRPPTPAPLAEIIGRARALAVSLDPPASFREALSIYRQMRAGGCVIIRCRFENN